MTQARTEPTLAPPPAAKPSKREKRDCRGCRYRGCGGSRAHVLRGSGQAARRPRWPLLEAKRPSALTAAEDLAGFQSSPHREREAGSSQRGTGFPSSLHREQEAGGSQRGTAFPSSPHRGAGSREQPARHAREASAAARPAIRTRAKWILTTSASSRFSARGEAAGFSGDTGGGNGRSMESPFLRLTAQAAKAASAGAQRILSGVANGAKAAGPLAQAARSKRPAMAPVEEPDSLDDLGAKLPPLSLLAHHAAGPEGSRSQRSPALTGARRLSQACLRISA